MKVTPDTQRKQTWSPIRVLSVAGSDSGGGAGLQADIKTISALGGYAATAVSAITVQNTLGVDAVYPVKAQHICEQVEAVCKDIKPQAIKISMLPDPETAEPLASILKKYNCKNIVIDPVMVATSGHLLTDTDAMNEMVKHLFPLASVVTPNFTEAKQLVGFDLTHIGTCYDAALKILKWEPKAVLIKGGHAPNGPVRDLLIFNGQKKPIAFSAGRLKTKNLHGTGCTLSAAIAFFLASGLNITKAVLQAKRYLHMAIKTGANMRLGSGNGPVNHLFDPLPLHQIRK